MAVLRFLLFAALAPVLVVQALRTRRGTPRLPGAGGPASGVTGTGPDFRLAVLGESTVDGVGARTHEEGLTGRLAELIAGGGLRVRWQAVGRPGASAAVVRRELVHRLAPADLVVIALGVNDTLELHSAARFRRDLLGVVVDVRRRLGPVPVVLAGVPPMGNFPALPRPLRDVLAARSAALDRAAAELARLPGVTYVAMAPGLLHDGTFAEDRFHPGPVGYREWAAALVAGSPAVTATTRPEEPSRLS
ncbi:SGNH/GDSL hydrolase family protein [Amycolatopsis sp. FDAARGOS 1241]|uniref:SGNH/GDSL hydrolase family protein n=1 Tax=Amycolatopsis sp. FDAARGOS 1241 TaxID=2778070 RepID=UPI00194ED3C4|nr:SGNH/GDSL hydrolase family protein [Amycolatopsis sp. FDAARGOS 1241]QRP45695.1 SGNH/GDSL hydrolase family protein [Amycolatopsis sp. FDAARGOS 1241]